MALQPAVHGLKPGPLAPFPQVITIDQEQDFGGGLEVSSLNQMLELGQGRRKVVDRQPFGLGLALVGKKKRRSLMQLAATKRNIAIRNLVVAVFLVDRVQGKLAR